MNAVALATKITGLCAEDAPGSIVVVVTVHFPPPRALVHRDIKPENISAEEQRRVNVAGAQGVLAAIERARP